MKIVIIGAPLSGKSSLLDELREEGHNVFQPDRFIAGSYKKGNEAYKRILEVFGPEFVNEVEVILLLEPAWTTDWISDEGRKKLMAYGISPPVEKTTDTSFINGRTPEIQCPVCKSFRTTMISRFGSTACKSLYKCEDCLEPFDYFKCH